MSGSIRVTEEFFHKALFNKVDLHIYAEKITEENFLDTLVAVADSPQLRISARDRFVGIVTPRVSDAEAKELHTIADTFGYYLCIDQMTKRVDVFNVSYSDIRVLKKPDSIRA